MYLLYTFLVGAMITVMVFFNGSLGNIYGIYTESALVHFVGIIFSVLVLKAQKKKIHLKKDDPWYNYLGGILGVATILLQTSAFMHISLTSIIALDLLGGTLAALLIDTFGLFHMEKHPFKKNNMFGLAVCFIGMYFMFNKADSHEVIGSLCALSAGASITISRCFNASLGESVGAMEGSLINHLVGFVPCVVIAFVMKDTNPNLGMGLFAAPWWMYLGGVCGVMLVYSNNLIVPHVSQMQMALLSFLGQFFCSFVVDAIRHVQTPTHALVGALMITFGVCLNTILSSLEKKVVVVPMQVEL